MSAKIQIMEGGRHADTRGTVDFVNSFDMSVIKRMYSISHHDTKVVRGWRGHKLEQRWFYVAKGSFDISFINISDFKNPDPNSDILTYTISAEEPRIIHAPTGYASALRALEVDSKVMVYADSSLENAGKDDYQYPIDYFIKFKQTI